MKKAAITALLSGILTFGAISPALAGPLPDNCTKEQGQVTCSTFEGPGKNQGGVGTTTTTETQGNTSNTSPAPQDLDQSQTCNPPSSNGRPCNP
jgi:hypothetical protein